MKIKVQCMCGSRFEFEVEPANGQMPVRINCPTCGADDTELANAVIQQQLATAPRVALKVSLSSPTAAAPAQTIQSETAPTVEICPRHKGEPVIETCHVCGKPICLKCMEQFGYVCGVYCRQQANQKHIPVPVYAGQKSVVAGRAGALAARLTYAAAALVACALGFWIWYAWFARDPKLVYSLPIPKAESDGNHPPKPEEYYQLIGPGELLSVKSKNANLFDIAHQRQIWSAPLLTAQEDYDLSNPLVAVTINDIWIAFHDHLVRLDRRTGQRKEISAPGRIINFLSGDTALAMVSVQPNAGQTLTRISLPDGAVETIDLPNSDARTPAQKNLTDNGALPAPTTADDSKPNQFTPASAAIARTLRNGTQPGGNMTVPAPAELLDNRSSSTGEIPALVLAGTNVVQYRSKLLEKLTITHEAMKPKGKSVLDDGNVTASQGLDLAQEMANDAARQATGGVEIEDVSRYQVTLHRWFAADASDWTGEVVGPPKLCALNTVLLLLAGQNLLVFDQHNKKLWEAKLTFPMHFPGNHPPCLETKDSLYLADVGMLTRFDLATGGVRWRLDSVGISSIQADDQRQLYLTSTTASPDQVLHPQQVNIHDKIHPIIMKVNPESGKVLWRLESVGANCLMSGKFLYATRVSKVQSPLRLEEGPDTHFNLDLLDPANGNTIWNYHKVNRNIVKTEVQQNWILLQYDDEVVVLKFFSL